MSIKDIQEEIIEEFDMFEDWMQRYEYIIESGKSLPQIDPVYKTDDALIKGCHSQVFLSLPPMSGLGTKPKSTKLGSGPNWLSAFLVNGHSSPPCRNGRDRPRAVIRQEESSTCSIS